MSNTLILYISFGLLYLSVGAAVAGTAINRTHTLFDRIKVKARWVFEILRVICCITYGVGWIAAAYFIAVFVISDWICDGYRPKSQT